MRQQHLFTPVADIMLEAAGCSEELHLDAPMSREYDEILQALKLIRAFKTSQYGSSRTDIVDTARSIVLLYADLERKWIRLDTQINKLLKGERISLDTLVETLSDLTAYGLLGLLVVNELIRKGKISHEKGVMFNG